MSEKDLAREGAGGEKDARPSAGPAKDELRCFVVGPIQTNCYAYVSAGECLVVDPGAAGEALAERLSDVRVTLVAATHGHGDHVGGAAALVRATGAPFAINPADAALAARAAEPSEIGYSYDDNAPEASVELREGTVLTVGTATFRVMEVPGHTPGGVLLVGGGTAEGVVFVGDTLFPGSHGRTDLEGGDEGKILESLARMADELAPSAALLCGHGPGTTMEAELASNPFLARA